MKILLSDISSYKSQVIAKYIKTHYPKTIVYTCDNRKLIKRIHTKYSDKNFIIEQKIDNLLYLKKIESIIVDNSIHYYFPVNSNEIDNVIKHCKDFNFGTQYWGEYSSFEIMNNKEKLSDLSSLVNMPKCYSSFNDARIPFIVKPSISSSSKGVRYFFSEENLNKQINENVSIDNCVIQEYINGVGCGYSVFATNGKIITGYGHKRLAEYPIKGGSSTYRTGYTNEDMKKTAEIIISKLNWSGFAMFEFKVTNKGEIFLIEVNPRVWGSINQGLQNGVNYFFQLLGDADNFKQNQKEYNTYLNPLVYVSFIKYFGNFQFKPIIRFIKNIYRNKADISFFNDFLGWLSLILRAR